MHTQTPLSLNIVHRQQFGPFSVSLFLPQVHIINTEIASASYCPNYNIIEIVALHLDKLHSTSKNPDHISPDTWNTVVNTRVANGKELPSISRVYSNSVINVQHAKNGFVTPNRSPLEMLAIYTGNMPDFCVETEQVTPAPKSWVSVAADYMNPLFDEIISRYALYAFLSSLLIVVVRLFSLMPTQNVSDVGTHGRSYLNICHLAYFILSAAIVTWYLLSRAISTAMKFFFRSNDDVLVNEFLSAKDLVSISIPCQSANVLRLL